MVIVLLDPIGLSLIIPDFIKVILVLPLLAIMFPPVWIYISAKYIANAISKAR